VKHFSLWVENRAKNGLLRAQQVAAIGAAVGRVAITLSCRFAAVAWMEARLTPLARFIEDLGQGAGLVGKIVQFRRASTGTETAGPESETFGAAGSVNEECTCRQGPEICSQREKYYLALPRALRFRQLHG